MAPRLLLGTFALAFAFTSLFAASAAAATSPALLGAVGAVCGLVLLRLETGNEVGLPAELVRQVSREVGDAMSARPGLAIPSGLSAGAGGNPQVFPGRSLGAEFCHGPTISGGLGHLAACRRPCHSEVLQLVLSVTRKK